MNDLEKILNKLENVKKSGENYTAKCVVHNDSSNSLSIFKTYDGNYIPFCHAGCSYQELKSALDLSIKKFKDRGIIEIYQYYKPDGSENYQNLRYIPKDFQARQMKNGNWVWNLEGIERTLFRLPELLVSDINRAVFYCEGEKDANRLAALDLVSVSGKWSDSFIQYLMGRVIYLILDNDDAGEKQGLKIAQKLYGSAKSIKLISFKGILKEKEDVSNYLDTHSLDEFKNLIRTIKDYSPSVSEFESIKEKQQLPASPELELRVIDSCFADNSLFNRSLDFLKESDFYLPLNRKVFKLGLESFEKTGNADKAIIFDKLLVQGELKENLLKIFENLKGEILSYYQFELYCKVLKHKSKLRMLMKACEYLQNKAREDESGEIFDEAEESIYGLNHQESNSVTNLQFESFGSIVNQVVEKAQHFQESGINLLGISTGYVDLDSMTQGLQRSDLIIVAARPSMGKTSLCLDIANATIQDNKKVAIFTLEMSKEQLAIRMICQNLELNSFDLRKGNLTMHQWEQVNTFKSLVTGSNIQINSVPGISPVQMRRALRRFVNEIGEPDLVIVDYLTLMSGETKNESKVAEVSYISKELKAIAKDFNVPLLAAAQLSRKPEERKSNQFRPIMSDLRDSGTIEQDADVVKFLYREDYYIKNSQYPGLTEIIYSKNRSGPTGTAYLQFIKEFTHFESSTQNSGNAEF